MAVLATTSFDTGVDGAVWSVLEPLLLAQAKATEANRTSSKAEYLKSQSPTIETVPLSRLKPEWDIVINATSFKVDGVTSLWDVTPFTRWGLSMCALTLLTLFAATLTEALRKTPT